MTTAPHLLNEDRPDFERVLTTAIRTVLDDWQDGESPLNGEQLRTRALAAGDEISAVVAQEYDTYCALRARTRDDARESARARENRAFGYAAMGVAEGAGSGAGLLAVMAVLTPLLAGAAAVIFLLIGYLLGAISPEPGIAHPLRTVGWFFALVTGAAVVLGGIGLLLTALRDSSAAIHDTPDAMPADVAAARDAWRDALLTRAMLPFLTTALTRTPTPTPPSPPATQLPHLGYSRPDFTSPHPPERDPHAHG
ncbi:hypothetical protein [Actinacidiphila acididurans]|uniref:Transmembrane protein n=1 Tax=Actinacidiphila acididurans TaxID=2784346 RepID=A0ABS2TRN5_9ACTN|nr:hypothetical protein [Actinacidiphila acididurans]MBM9505993.1 hypothetical protein [Actinacidiphila acididurans]